MVFYNKFLEMRRNFMDLDRMQIMKLFGKNVLLERTKQSGVRYDFLKNNRAFSY